MIRIKIAITLVVTLVSLQTFAAPRMDTALGTDGPILATVLPDHEDPHLYYVFPQSSTVLVGASGNKNFLYVENRFYRRRSFQVLNANLRLGIGISIQNPTIALKVEEIKSHDPAAKFTVVTAFQTEVVPPSSSAGSFVLRSNCNRIQGPLEVPVYCDLEIRPSLSLGLRKVLQYTQGQVLSYVYHFYGFADGKMSDYAYAVPLVVGSLQGKPYFVDQFGESL